MRGFLCAERHGEELHICAAGVRLDSQPVGIGHRLMSATIQAARDSHIASITLTTFGDVAWNAPFYERLGFCRLGRRNTNDRLRAVLRSEAIAGLPTSRRCAMQLTLTSDDDELGYDN